MSSKISVLVPGIRPEKWMNFYKSVCAATKESFEVIFVGPKSPPKELEAKSNVIFVRDFGGPTRGQQIALTYSSGEYIIWAADDTLMTEGSIDKCLAMFPNWQYKDVVVGKYTESDNPSPDMFTERYYTFKHNTRINTPYLPPDWYLFMVGMARRDYIMELGGWDAASFNTCAMAHIDFGIRAQQDGARCKLTDFIVLKCEWLPFETGDHKPICLHHHNVDEPNLVKHYSNPEWIKRTHVDVDNWQSSPAVWGPRYGDIKVGDECELSIVIPALRSWRFRSLYDSICRSMAGRSFELILVGPNDPGSYLRNQPNVKWISDLGSPSRCSQLGLLRANGTVVTRLTDDALFEDGALSRVMDLYWKCCESSYKNVVSLMYTEGPTAYNPKEWYVNHGEHARSKFIPDDYLLVMVPFVDRRYLIKEIGGWDCIFDGPAMCNVDLGIRMQRGGSKVFIFSEKAMSCDHEAGMSGHHGPAHLAFSKDMQTYRSIYDNENCLRRVKVDIRGWQSQPDIWALRFS